MISFYSCIVYIWHVFRVDSTLSGLTFPELDTNSGKSKTNKVRCKIFNKFVFKILGSYVELI